MQLTDIQLVSTDSQSISSDAPDACCNSYNPERPSILPEELYGPTPYDFNFCFPYLPQSLETDQIKVIPFVPRLHAELLFQHTISHPEDFRYMAFTAPKTVEELLEYFEIHYRRDPSKMAFVCVDKKADVVGGMVTLVDCDPHSKTATFAMGMAFRGFRGTSGASLSTALVLRYCLNTMSDAVPGLGLRRVQWTNHSDNILSQKLSRWLGLRFESEQRWFRVVPRFEAGKRTSAACRRTRLNYRGPMWCSPLCGFDDWEAGAKQAICSALGTTQYEARL